MSGNGSVCISILARAEVCRGGCGGEARRERERECRVFCVCVSVCLRLDVLGCLCNLCPLSLLLWLWKVRAEVR